MHRATHRRLLVLGWGLCVALAQAPGSISAQAPTSAKPAPEAAEVKLRDTPVLRVLRERGQLSPQQRARAASRALEHALATAPEAAVRVEAQNEGRAVYVGAVPIVELYAEDASAAGESLDVYAARVAARVREALEAERKRSDIAQTVFSISLVVFFGLIALYLVRRIGEISGRAREYALQNPEKIGAVRVSSVEVIGAGPLRAALLAALIIGRFLLSIGVVYVWLALSLSRFEVTRPYMSQLTDALLSPFSALAQRTLSALPVALLLLMFAVGVYVLVRFVELFFVGVIRGEARAHWLPRDLIEPASALIRVAIVVLAVVLAGPIVSGDPDGVLARAGSAMLFALALAATPLLLSLGLGCLMIFSRRLRVGGHVQLGPHRGRITAVSLIDVRLRDADGCEVRVPHVMSLVRSVRVESEARISVELCVSPKEQLVQVKELLEQAARGVGHGVQVELREIDAEGACYRVGVIAGGSVTASDLRLALAQVLAREGVSLGRRAGGVAP